MEIIHRMSINSNNKRVIEKLKNLGLTPIVKPLPGSDNKLIVIDISESNKYWEDVVKIVGEYRKIDPRKPGGLVQTVFSEGEIRNAEWLRMKCTFEQGYPQPENTWPMKQKTFELLCNNCFIYNQKTNFKLKKIPNFGVNQFTKTIWTEEIFCNNDVLHTITGMNAKGIEFWDITTSKTNEAFQGIKQIFIPSIANFGLLFEDSPKFEICQKCGEKKYYPHVRGKMKIKQGTLVKDLDFQMTNEWFGNGNLSWREMIVSNRIANLVLDNNWKGISFKVIEVI